MYKKVGGNMPADINRNLTDTVSTASKMKRFMQKATQMLWKALWSFIRFIYFTATGRELPEHFLKNKAKDAREGIGKELFSRERRREVELDGTTKQIVRYDFDTIEALKVVEAYGKEPSGLRDRNGRPKPAPFLLSARDENGKIQLTQAQANRMARLHQEYEHAVEMRNKYEIDYANTHRKSDLKKYEKWSHTAEEDLIRWQKNKTYKLCMNGISLYVNASRSSTVERIVKEISLDEDKVKVKEMRESIGKTTTHNKNMKETFLKEVVWEKEGLYGPMTQEELGKDYYACTITQKELKILQNTPDIQNKPFTILKEKSGELLLLTPMSMEAVTEMNMCLEHAEKRDRKYKQYRNGILVESVNNKMHMPVSEYEKLRENELAGTKYDQSFEVVNGELYTTLTDYTLPDGSKDINAMERYAKEVEKNRDKSEYRLEQSKEKEKQEEIADRPIFSLRNGTEWDNAYGYTDLTGNAIEGEKQTEPESEIEFDSGKGTMTRKEKRESQDRRQQVMGDTEMTIETTKTEELTYDE